MEKKRLLTAIVGILLNLFFAAIMVMLVIQYKTWESANIASQARLVYDQKQNHIFMFELLPITTGAMLFSACMFWKLRK
jgi:phosphate/sulfate permease